MDKQDERDGRSWITVEQRINPILSILCIHANSTI